MQHGTERMWFLFSQEVDFFTLSMGCLALFTFVIEDHKFLSPQLFDSLTADWEAAQHMDWEQMRMYFFVALFHL